MTVAAVDDWNKAIVSVQHGLSRNSGKRTTANSRISGLV